MRLNFRLCVVGVLFLFIPGYAIFEENDAGVRAEAMSGAFVAVADDISAIDLNPAGLSQVRTRQFHGFYKLLFGGAGVGLHTLSAAGCIPGGRAGTFGIRLQETGFALSAQRSFKLAHGFGFGTNGFGSGVFFGYGLNGYNLQQKGYGQGWTVGLDLGMLARVDRFWSAGFCVHNINMPKIGGSEVERTLKFGVAFTPSPGIHSALDFSKESGNTTRVAFGQEFEILPHHLILRAGAHTSPVSFSFGLGTGTERVRVDYSLSTHEVLPLTHNLGVTVEF